MILIILGSSLSFENPFTIRPVLCIFEYFVSISFFLFTIPFVSHNYMTSFHLTNGKLKSLMLPGNGTMNFPHIIPSYCTPSPFHDKGYFPCCMCTNDKMWMWFHLFVCVFSLHSFWTTTLISVLHSIFISVVFQPGPEFTWMCPETFTYEKCSPVFLHHFLFISSLSLNSINSTLWENVTK